MGPRVEGAEHIHTHEHARYAASAQEPQYPIIHLPAPDIYRKDSQLDGRGESECRANRSSRPEIKEQDQYRRRDAAGAHPRKTYRCRYQEPQNEFHSSLRLDEQFRHPPNDSRLVCARITNK